MAFERVGKAWKDFRDRGRRSMAVVKEQLDLNRKRYEIVKRAPSERVRQKLRMAFDYPTIRPWMFFNTATPLGYKRNEDQNWDVEAWEDVDDVVALLKGLSGLHALEIQPEAKASQREVIGLIETELRYRSEEKWSDYQADKNKS